MFDKDYFNFSEITKEQRTAVKRMESLGDEFIYHLFKIVPSRKHQLKAHEHIRKALQQCRSGILFNWNLKNT